MDIIDRINLKFKSGNEIPVSHTFLSAKEWEEIRARMIPKDWSMYSFAEFAARDGTDLTLDQCSKVGELAQKMFDDAVAGIVKPQCWCGETTVDPWCPKCCPEKSNES